MLSLCLPVLHICNSFVSLHREEGCSDPLTCHCFFQMWMLFQGLHNWSSVLGTQNMPKPSSIAPSTATPSGQTSGLSTWTSWSNMAARRKCGELCYSRLGTGRVWCLEQYLKRAEVLCSMMMSRASQSKGGFVSPRERKLGRVERVAFPRTGVTARSTRQTIVDL